MKGPLKASMKSNLKVVYCISFMILVHICRLKSSQLTFSCLLHQRHVTMYIIHIVCIQEPRRRIYYCIQLSYKFREINNMVYQLQCSHILMLKIISWKLQNLQVSPGIVFDFKSKLLRGRCWVLSNLGVGSYGHGCAS